MQKSACQRGRFSVNTSLLLTNASRKRKPNGAAGHRKQSRTSPRQTENLASQHRLQLRVEGFPSGQREQTVNLSSMTSVVRIHHLPPVNKGTPFGVLLLFKPDKYMRYREKSNCFSGKTEGSMDIDAFIKHLNRKGLSYQEK